MSCSPERLASYKKYREKNREKVRAACTNYRIRTRHSHWLVRMIGVLKERAKQKGLEFNLTKEDFVVPEVCPVLGIPLKPLGNRNNTPSFDRLDNTKGYVKGNVQIISFKANRIKSDATLEELEKILAYYKAGLNK